MSFNLKKHNYLVCDFNHNWIEATAKIIYKEIKKNYRKKNEVRIMTAAGEAASSLHNRLSRMISVGNLKNIKIFLADERCVSQYHSNSNYKAIKKIYSTTRNAYIYKFFYSEFGSAHSIRRYQRYLNGKVDILILGMANDGHIASLFSSHDLINSDDKLIIIKRDYEIFERLSINYDFIDKKCIKVYLLVNSIRKKRLLKCIASSKSKNSPLHSIYQREKT